MRAALEARRRARASTRARDATTIQTPTTSSRSDGARDDDARHRASTASATLAHAPRRRRSSSRATREPRGRSAARARARGAMDAWTRDAMGRGEKRRGDAATRWRTFVDDASELEGATEAERRGFARAALAAYAREAVGRAREGGGDEDDEADDEEFAARAVRACVEASIEEGEGEDDDAWDFADVCRGLSELWCRGRARGADGRTVAEALGRARDVAMARAQSEAVITPQDACYLRVCLKLKAYDALAASDGILAAPAMDVAPALDATDFLLRCYYGGRALLALRRYPEAARWFQNALSAPATALSAIAVAAYKKYALATLLADAVADASTFSAPAKKYSTSRECDAYASLLAAAKKRDAAKELADVVERHEATYELDGNAGLVALVRDRAVAAKARSLAKTYSTLRLGDFASAIGFSDVEAAERVLYGMIVRGEIAARIDGVDGVVRFSEGDESSATIEDIAEALKRGLRAVSVLDARVREESDALSRHKKFASHALTEERRAAALAHVETES
jgi:COP9 signalosome complex subunit 3